MGSVSYVNVKVEKKDIDDLNHVNNSVYLTYLGKGREDWYINAAGSSFKQMYAKDIATVVMRIDILFKKEAVINDSLQVITRPKKLGVTSYTFEQEIINNQGEVISEATVTNVMINLTTRKSIPVIDSIARNFKQS